MTAVLIILGMSLGCCSLVLLLGLCRARHKEPDPYDYAEAVDRSAELRHQIDFTV